MSFAFIHRDGIRLRYETAGDGPPVIFQHGLGGGAAQVAEVFPETAPVRRMTLECRAHGDSESGPFAAFSIAIFAGDVAFLAHATGAMPAVVGGISMGAAVALKLAVTEPSLVKALILARPAWLWTPAPENLSSVALAAELLDRLGPQAGREALAKTEAAARLEEEAPDNLASLYGYFDSPDPQATAALVGAIAADGLGVTEEEAGAIAVPTLVIGTEADVIHPMDFARQLAATIPGARLAEIASKSADRRRYAAEFGAVVADFLGQVAG